ncbi:MAG: MBL fold metallo-hydrolase [Anaeromyxobacter sp.]
MPKNQEPERKGTAGERGYEAEDEGGPPEEKGQAPGEQPEKQAPRRADDRYTPARPGGEVPDELRRDPLRRRGRDVAMRRTTLTLGARAGADAAHGSILFVGTATLVVQLGPFTLLTDPNFLHAGEHADLGYGMTSRRLTDPAIEIDQLPPLDAVVLSHYHGDHWDRVATAHLSRELPVLTTPHAARALRRLGFGQAQGLATWDEATLRRGSDWLRITATPGRHGPPLVHRLLPPVMGSVWEVGHAGGAPHFRLYVTGDTLMYDDLRRIPERFAGFDLAVLHLGGTRVMGVLVTMDAAQGVEAVRLLQPEVAIPIHHDDYPVFKSPLEDFARAVAEAGLAQRVKFLARGERHALAFRGFPRVVPVAPPTARRPDLREGEGAGAGPHDGG